MAIRPISPISYANGYNKVTFESRKHKRGDENYSNPIRQKLAVPLAATIIAINSLSATSKPLDRMDINEPNKIEMVDGMQQSSRVFASKTFAKEYDPALGSYTPKVKLINTKGGSGFDKIEYSLVMHDRNNYDSNLGEVVGVNSSKLTIVGDDGVRGHAVSVKALKMAEGLSKELYVGAEELRYIENAIKSSDNHGKAKIYNYNSGVRMTYRELQNVPNGDILKDAKPAVSSFGKKCGEGRLDGDNGAYMLRVYSPDGSDENIDDITIQRNGYPELQVRGIYVENAVFNKDCENEQKLSYGKIALMGDDKNGKRQLFFIQDDMLTAKLIRFIEQNKLEKNLNGIIEIQNNNANYLVEEEVLIPIIE